MKTYKNFSELQAKKSPERRARIEARVQVEFEEIPEWEIALFKWWETVFYRRSLAVEDSFKAGWDAAKSSINRPTQNVSDSKQDG